MGYVLCFVIGFVLGAFVLALVFKQISKKELSSKGEVTVSLEKDDIILKVNEEHKCGKDGLKVGKYTLLTTNEEVSSFNIKVSGVVREYKHSSSVVLGEGDTIMSVSHNVILRK